VQVRHRARQAVNLVNGSTLAGLAVARLGTALPRQSPEISRYKHQDQTDPCQNRLYNGGFDTDFD